MGFAPRLPRRGPPGREDRELDSQDSAWPLGTDHGADRWDPAGPTKWR